MAVSNVDSLNNGEPITYEELLDFNGYLNVHTGSTFVVQGDIGGNELTGDTKEYTLMPVADPAVSGKVTFAKRKKGTTLVTIDLDGTQPGATHPTHIHQNTVAEGGGIVIDLKTLDGTTGMSQTSVDTLNDGTAITYEEMLDFNGYLNVHTGSTFVVQGDIGQNELTGDKKEYALAELDGSGVSGIALFEKRKNGKTQITLNLTGTVAGGDHPAHIHANDAATGGGIVLDLNNVNGATGKSVTSANAMRDGTPVTYDELLVYNGHINVHLSPAQLATRIAQGNIGSNAP
jgi:predicted aconitase with swiveling domain